MKRIKNIYTKIKEISIKLILTIPAILVGLFLIQHSWVQKMLITFAKPCIDLWFPKSKKEIPQVVQPPTIIPEDNIEDHTFY